MLRTTLSAACLSLGLAHGAAAEPPAMRSEVLEETVVPQANQAVAVDADHFYAIDNRTIAKYDKRTHQMVDKWEGPKGGPIEHLDSGVVIDGRIFLSHSNYPRWPMTSSIEVFDAATLTHVDSHSFGIQIGSLTWLDKGPDGHWYAGFANYNRVFDKSPIAYGNKYNTQVVRLDDDWRIAEAWVIPDEIVEKFEDMSNSGGSWGPDGRLYLTGHDPAEAYVMELPKMGSILTWIATVPVANRGQGIAWDRSQPDVLYAIIRGEGDEENKVTANRIDLGSAPKAEAAGDAVPAAQ